MPLYHVWFATKRRKWILQGDVEAIVEDSIWEAARSRDTRLLECKAAVDHLHILLELEAPQALPMAMRCSRDDQLDVCFNNWRL